MVFRYVPSMSARFIWLVVLFKSCAYMFNFCLFVLFNRETGVNISTTVDLSVFSPLVLAILLHAF